MTPRKLFILLGILIPALGLTTPILAVETPESLTLLHSFEVEEEPLTTAKIWQVAPEVTNPHRHTWVLERRLELEDLEERELENGKGFGVELDELVSSAHLYLRPAGPWYKGAAQFDCALKPNSWFQTRSGSLQSGQAVAEAWAKLVAGKKLALEVRLNRLSAKTPELAMTEAQAIFHDWKSELNEAYAELVSQQRKREWSGYLADARKNGTCPAKGGQVTSRPFQPKDFTPPPEMASTRLLVRAPAKRWNGRYSIRLSVHVGKLVLNGQFLIDSSAPVSLMSPEWLRGQGVLAPVIRIRRAANQKVRWAGGTAIGPPAIVDEVRIADQTIDLKLFILAETEIFQLPKYSDSCCDGVLGSDFLRKFPVTFVPGQPSAVLVHERQGFSLGKKVPWVELSMSSDGLLKTDACTLDPLKIQGGALWDTGSAGAIEVHHAFAARAPGERKLVCAKSGGELSVVSRFPMEVSSRKKKEPAFTVGMDVLGRGEFTFDLPNGRLWFAPETLEKPVPQNRSGLELKFEFDKNANRILKVVRIKTGTPAASLKKSGLKEGMRITRLNSIGIDELDDWQVEQHLAGVYGSQVTLRWNTAKGAKIVPLKVK